MILPSFGYFDEYQIQPDVSWADLPAFEPDQSSAFIQSIIEAMNASSFQNGEITDISIMPLYTLDNGSTPINSGLRSIMRNLIGPYSPVVVQFQYTNGTNTAYLREILPDYEWMFDIGIFALVLYCTFRIGGAFLCRK